MQTMLDIPLHKHIVNFSDLAKFNVSTFGADTIIRHLTDGGSAILPVFPIDSLSMRHFRHAVVDDEESDSSSEEGDKEIEKAD
jgi:hypothetical protein